ncbi:hypothetical protein [Bradyrhizobium diazoefficiens]|uniref:hypothetical protein n=1 Tax=Bradyrhizobium diazoefficiens TaxID=1355477 RepID=UPI00272BAD5D|nr:hypothetical protein [Bradyrhizobium diazoefficiens]WLA68068.1 hypothetical protein QNN01_16205 [Bradyrhizobium diazoefficiens]
MKEISTPVGNVVEIAAQSDRTFTFTGLGSGTTVVIARSDDGRVVAYMRVIVGGHLVKVYGLTGEPDYLGVLCDEYGCGRESSQAKASSTTVRKPLQSGGFIEKNYQ